MLYDIVSGDSEYKLDYRSVGRGFGYRPRHTILYPNLCISEKVSQNRYQPLEGTIFVFGIAKF